MEITEYKFKQVDNNEVIRELEKKAGQFGISASFRQFREQIFCEVDTGQVKKFLRILNSDAELSFEYLKCMTAVDYVDYLEMVYCLYSFKNNWSVNIKVKLDSQEPQIDSIADIYRGADWYEREMAEMFGISIKGHPNLNPLLLAGDEGGCPLRKSFEIKWEERQYIPPEKFE